MTDESTTTTTSGADAAESAGGKSDQSTTAADSGSDVSDASSRSERGDLSPSTTTDAPADGGRPNVGAGSSSTDADKGASTPEGNMSGGPLGDDGGMSGADGTSAVGEDGPKQSDASDPNPEDAEFLAGVAEQEAESREFWEKAGDAGETVLEAAAAIGEATHELIEGVVEKTLGPVMVFPAQELKQEAGMRSADDA